MRIDVKDLLRMETGTTKDFGISGEPLELADITFVTPATGEIKVLHSQDGIIVHGSLVATLQLECHRCLRAFDREGRISLNGEYADHPVEDQWPIIGDAIDLDPLLRQEFLLDIPIQILCQEDCPGLCEVCGKRDEPTHQHALEANKHN